MVASIDTIYTIVSMLLACNLLSNFVCTFKNVAEGCIHAKNANMGGAV